MERDRFKWLWLKGEVFIERVRAFCARRRRHLLLSFGAVLLYLLIFQVAWPFFWVAPNQKLVAERITPSWKRELTQKEFFELQNSYRQTLVQAVGGAALLFGFCFTAWTLHLSQKTLQVAQEGQITERFTKAIEHLGDARLAVQLGGIYALERIAHDSDKDHWPIMEILTTYVRDNAPWPPKEVQPPSHSPDPEAQSPEIHTGTSSTGEDPVLRPIPTDIQAILTVIGRRARSSSREGGKYLNLCNTDLRSANLRNAQLEGANLKGANLEGANLYETQLEGAFLQGAHLKGAYLMWTHLEKGRLMRAHLEGMDLFSVHLEGAFLMGAHLEGAFLQGAHLEGAELSGAHLEGAFLQGAHLKGADLDEAHLEGASIGDEELATVHTMAEASLDPALREKIQRIAPHLLQRHF